MGWPSEPYGTNKACERYTMTLETRNYATGHFEQKGKWKDFDDYFSKGDCIQCFESL